MAGDEIVGPIGTDAPAPPKGKSFTRVAATEALIEAGLAQGRLVIGAGIIRARDIDEAMNIENASPYGNAAAIYTKSGQTARSIGQRASAGMIGVNIGVPVPVEPFGFGGWNDSKFGVGDITGKSSIEFWTLSKKTTTRWV